ncbi:uncharacterized protein N7483_006313 [Penicillium malachiteum]|uniref:uncharacterized protein n=1 Tax=Penicillium malachiteum TaxID=1324776 RepID=UPI002549844C|nr:uncharacterized protein N7483_006313 [Penicillium malachiteum]KAJ5731805.1 hypothetical protein N7483_006313 [Penicillium malachiteum]
MNKATIKESRKAIKQSGRLKRLTLLATLFIPISFSSSLLAYGFYLWDSQFLKRYWESFWKGYKGTTRNLKFRRYKKDSEYIV